MQNFSTRLADAIARSGKSKGSLAAHCGVALSTVSRWIGGMPPKAEMMERIACFLGVDAKWLLTGLKESKAETCLRLMEESPSCRIPEESHEASIRRMEEALTRMAGAIEDLTRLMRDDISSR